MIKTDTQGWDQIIAELQNLPGRPVPRVGDWVSVRGGFGSEPPQVVQVEEIDEKNGRPLICYTDHEGLGRWAYFDQIEEADA